MENKAVEVSDSVLESFERFCDANSLLTLFESYGGNNVYVYSDTKAAWIAWKAAHALYGGDAKRIGHFHKTLFDELDLLLTDPYSSLSDEALSVVHDALHALGKIIPAMQGNSNV